MPLKTLTIKKTTEFKNIKNNCKKFHCHTLILQEAFTPDIYISNFNNHNFCRFGITVSKVVSKSACERNLAKRRIRHALLKALPNLANAKKDYVVIAKKQIIEANYDKIYNDLVFALKKINTNSIKTHHLQI